MNFPAENNPEGNLFIECANGNKDAETCVTTIYSYIDWLDNIIDKDVSQSTELSAKTSLNLFLMLSFNVFWEKHKQALAGSLITGFNAWLDSEILKTHKDYRFRLTADVLKGYFMEFFYQVAFITGGYDLMRKLSQKWRGVDFDSGEHFEDSTNSKRKWVMANQPHLWNFPADHNSHPFYAIEWWYFSGNLKMLSKDIGYHYCQFRLGDNDYRTHVSIFKDGKLFQEEKFHSENLLDFSFAGRMVLEFEVQEISIKLELKHAKEVILHGNGKDGLSLKSERPGHATHYYSICDIRTKGAIQVKGDRFETFVQGRSWFEHEFGSHPNPVGFRWVFFYAHMKSGHIYHAYILINDGKIDQNNSKLIKYYNGIITNIPEPFEILHSEKNILNLITSEGLFRVVVDSKEPEDIHTSLGTYTELPCIVSYVSDTGEGYLEITK
jgi:CrtC N-terminal lipocalin domain